jgi:hypothetical protein
MRTTVVLVGLMSSSIATAKPLPANVKLSVAQGHLMVTMDGVTVPLVEAGEPRGLENFPDLGDPPPQLSDDGKNLVLTNAGCTGIDDPITVPLTRVQARVLNAVGMQLHLKKKYPDAIAKFAAAVQADPDSPVLQTNLLSAQSRGGKLDDADKIVTTYGPKNLAWYGWRLGVDADLAALRVRPAVKAILAPHPSKLTLASLGDDLAISPLGLVGVNEWISLGMGPGASDFAVYDLKTNKQLLRLPIDAIEDACFDSPPSDVGGMPVTKCGPTQKAHRATHTKSIEAMLQLLGFERAKTIWIEQHNQADAATSKDKQWKLDLGDPPVVVHGSQKIALPPDFEPAWFDVGIADRAIVVRSRTMYACGGADSRQSTSTVEPR